MNMNVGFLGTNRFTNKKELKVFGRIARIRCQAYQLNTMLNERRALARHMHTMESDMGDAVWEHLRVRLRTGLLAGVMAGATCFQFVAFLHENCMMDCIV